MHSERLIVQWFVIQSEVKQMSLSTSQQAHPKEKAEERANLSLLPESLLIALTRLQELCAALSAHLTFLLWSLLQTMRNWKEVQIIPLISLGKKWQNAAAACSQQQHHKQAFPLSCWSNYAEPGRKLLMLKSGGCKEHVSAFQGPAHLQDPDMHLTVKRAAAVVPFIIITLQIWAKTHLTKQMLFCRKKLLQAASSGMTRVR